jgi:hypothetical protein
LDDIALATAIAHNTRFETDPDGLYQELLGDFRREQTERVWKLACEIHEEHYPGRPAAA